MGINFFTDIKCRLVIWLCSLISALTACAQPDPPSFDLSAAAGTLSHKLLMGYQGWFACPGDGSMPNRWVHWFRRNEPAATNFTVDFWPDVAELDADELFPTQMTMPDGSPARLYSAFNAKTVPRHSKPMLLRWFGCLPVSLNRWKISALAGNCRGANFDVRQWP